MQVQICLEFIILHKCELESFWVNSIKIKKKVKYRPANERWHSVGFILNNHTVHHSSKHTLSFILIPLVQYPTWDTQATESRMSSLNRSIIFCRIYEYGVSGQTCRCHPARLWCFMTREIDPADVGVLRTGAAFLPPLLFHPFSSFLSFPFLPRNEWTSWGEWPVTGREETRLSALSDSQSGWLVV